MADVVAPVLEVKEDIASIEETFAAVKELVETAFAVLEDGKVTIGDITKLPALFVEVKKIIEAVQGIGAEAADLDSEELKKVMELVIDLGMFLAAKFGAKAA